MSWLGIAVLFAVPVFGQGASRFDAVSIKLSPKLPRQNTCFSVVPPDGARWRQYSVSVIDLVNYAYDLSSFDLQIEGGPDWAKTQCFAINATTSAPNVSNADLRAMVQAMLADRFQLVSHLATESLSVSTLSVAAGGATLRPASGNCDPNPPPGRPAPGALPGCGTIGEGPSDKPDTSALRGRSVSMPQLAQWFLSPLARLQSLHPVVDETGLKGTFDFDVTVPMLHPADGTSAMEEADAYRANTVALEKAFEQQTGLEIDLFRTVKRPVPVRVIDSVHMPSNEP